MTSPISNSTSIRHRPQSSHCRGARSAAILALFLLLSIGTPALAFGDEVEYEDFEVAPLTPTGVPAAGTTAALDQNGSATTARQLQGVNRDAYQLLAKMVFHILAFDRKLDERCKYGAVRVVIVRGEEAASRQEAAGLAHELEKYRGNLISGLPYEYQITDHAPENESYEVIFLPSGLPPSEVRSTLNRTGRAGVLCLTTDASYLASGATVAIVLTESKPQIVIRKDRAIAQGAEFDPRLYKYSTVIAD